MGSLQWLSAALPAGVSLQHKLMFSSLDKCHCCFFPLVLSKLSSSFGNLDPFGTGQPLPPLQLPQQTAPQSVVLPLKKPPKWIRRPMGASFSVRGRLGWAGLAKQVGRLCWHLLNSLGRGELIVVVHLGRSSHLSS